VPFGIVVSRANTHDNRIVQAALQSSPIPGPATREWEPQNMCQEKGYDYPDVRQLVEGYGYTPHVPECGCDSSTAGHWPHYPLNAG
jgi:putative transposase